ncbi:MAG: hypothetical protein ACC634_08555 [Hyphomicrobiales bacterium]
MLKGRDALKNIDRALAQARDEAATLRQRLEKLARRRIKALEDQRGAYEDLAEFRLDATARGVVRGALDQAGRRASELLKERQRQADDNQRAETGLTTQIDALEVQREAAAQASDTASQNLDEAAAELQARLEADADYMAQLARVEAAEKVAEAARAKLAAAQTARQSKGVPYDADPLFMYLWRRDYGLSTYDHKGLVRTLDQWVARLVGYDSARPNYYMLLEIPQRLGPHVEAMQAVAEAQMDKLVAREAAMRDASQVPELEETLNEKLGRLDALDADIAIKSKRLRELTELRASFAKAQDPAYRDAVGEVSKVLENYSLGELGQAARATPDPADEAIVARLVDAEKRLERTGADREELTELAEAAERRLAQVEDMRLEFRRRSYDDYSSSFTDSAMFSAILGEFLRGAISGAVYWKRLDRQHRRRPRRSRAHFGSGKFRASGPLSFPGSSGGGFGGGGFSSGGGFGGGGFKTGGGF